jgi:hypothetical protein
LLRCQIFFGDAFREFAAGEINEAQGNKEKNSAENSGNDGSGIDQVEHMFRPRLHIGFR